MCGILGYVTAEVPTDVCRAALAKLNHRMDAEGGILEDETAGLMRSFFASRRAIGSLGDS